MIAASHLIRRFGPRLAVNDLTLQIAKSEIVALLGPNGAGKTTTLRMMAGLIAPSSGTVSIDGIELTRATGSALRGRIGFLTESPGLWDRLTVRENLSAYADFYARSRQTPSGGAACHDLLAVQAAVDPDVITEAPVLPLAVDTGGSAAWGATIADRRTVIRYPGPGFTPWRISLAVDTPKFRAAFRSLLT